MDQTSYALLVGGAMVAVFLVAWWRNVPHIISLILAAITGALVAGHGLPTRHLVEGTFMFFDLVLVILTATIFVGVLRANGSLNVLILDVIRRFHRQPLLLLSLLTLVVMLPGALTGSGTAAVLAVGSLVGSVLIAMGIPPVTTASIIALAGVVGSFAPPVNIPAMAMANGINMPYVGLFMPLAIISIPLGIGGSLALGARYLKRDTDLAALTAPLESQTTEKPNWVVTYVPFVLVLVLMIGARVFPSVFPDLGIPLVFVIGTVLALLLKPGINVPKVFQDSVQEAMPVASILIGVGAFVQIMTLTGVRGLFVVTAVTLPEIALYVFTLVGFVIAGALLGSYGSGTVFGIPVTLAFLDRDPVIAIIGLSLMAAYSSLTPPTAIVGQAAAMSVRLSAGYSAILRKVALPWLIASLIGLAIVVFADELSFLVSF